MLLLYYVCMYITAVDFLVSGMNGVNNLQYNEQKHVQIPANLIK